MNQVNYLLFRFGLLGDLALGLRLALRLGTLSLGGRFLLLHRFRGLNFSRGMVDQHVVCGEFDDVAFHLVGPAEHGGVLRPNAKSRFMFFMVVVQKFFSHLAENPKHFFWKFFFNDAVAAMAQPPLVNMLQDIRYGDLVRNEINYFLKIFF